MTICGELYYYDSGARTELGSSGMRTPSQLPPARVVVSRAPCRSILYGVIIIIYIYVAQRRRPRIFYIYMTYTRLHNILLYYTHTQTNAHTHAYTTLAAYTVVRVIGSANIYPQPGGYPLKVCGTVIEKRANGQRILCNNNHNPYHIGVYL